MMAGADEPPANPASPTPPSPAFTSIVASLLSTFSLIAAPYTPGALGLFAAPGGVRTTDSDAEALGLGSSVVTALFAMRNSTSLGDSGASFEELAAPVPASPLGPPPDVAGIGSQPLLVGGLAGAQGLGSVLRVIAPPLIRSIDNLGIDLGAVFRSLLRFMAVPRSAPGKPAGNEPDRGTSPPRIAVREEAKADREWGMIVLMTMALCQVQTSACSAVRLASGERESGKSAALWKSKVVAGGQRPAGPRQSWRVVPTRRDVASPLCPRNSSAST
jgi:hypothetical protein